MSAWGRCLGACGRSLRAWVLVNGGVVAVAAAVTSLEAWVADTVSGGAHGAVSAFAATALLYCLTFSACSLNLRGRRRLYDPKCHPSSTPVPLRHLIWHPLGSCLERWLHVSVLPLGLTALEPTSPWWWASLAGRLLAFEVLFDAFFYVAHRAVHSNAALYAAVHKQHHVHKHDSRLTSALQMTAADVALTHTLPVLGALLLVPIAPGLELSIVKAYLLFQEAYGHAGCAHRGRNFGPAPWVVQAMGVELRSEDHQLHHIRAGVNFSKRFSLFDRLGGTYERACPPEWGRGATPSAACKSE
jgi:sterol desaturase/sphingolipid hydroxylase (fatty acid hydroxylase superfamily)